MSIEQGTPRQSRELSATLIRCRMKETIQVEVVEVVDMLGDKCVLELQYDRANDTINIVYNGKPICRCDWSDNLQIAFKRALTIWE